MKTQIINYGTADENYILPGTYDEHTVDTCQGVYGKAEMVRFVHIVTDRFLTPRQKYFYFQCVVYGKKVENVAEQEGLDASTVYKHLKLAKRKIANLKEIMQVSGGRKGTIVLFQQAVQTMTSDCQTVAIEKYVNGLTTDAIAKKIGMTHGQVLGFLSHARNRLRWCGIEKADLYVVRDYFKKQKAKERE